jgi:hypothetical protein
MLQALWVEYKTEDDVHVHKVPINDCILVEDLIKKIRNTPQLGVPKDLPIILHGPSGMIIRADECPSSLISGNSQETPIHVQVSVPLPVIEKQTTNSTLTSFWNSLSKLSDEDGFLHFSVIPEFFPEGMKALYVRKAYKDLFKIIWNYVYPETRTERLHRIAIAGTPGIGKSVFLFYVLWRLAKAGIDNVVLDREKDLKRSYVFRSDKCWVTSDFSEIRRILDDPNSWHLIDSHKNMSLHARPITIFMTWPIQRYFQLFPMLPGTAKLHFLPPWSIEELELAAPLYSRGQEVVDDRYYMIGGNPRFVLEKETPLEELVKDAIDKLTLQKLSIVASFQLPEKDEILLLILHFFVEAKSGYLKSEPSFASQAVSKMATDKFLDTQHDESMAFIRGDLF